jgi:PAS domain S-box-containing protein
MDSVNMERDPNQDPKVIAEQEARRLAEQKYHEIFENVREGVFQTTTDGKFITANPALARMLGFDSPAELIAARTDIAREHYVDSQRREEFKELLNSEGVVRDFELEAYRKDGSRIWICENVRTVRDDQGELLYYEGTCQDITERKNAEGALRESEERYRELFENARDVMYVHDLKGRYTSVNRAAEKLLGFSRAEIVGRHYSNFVAPSHLKYPRENFCKKLDYEVETNYEVDLIAKNGRRIPVEVNSRLILENGVPVGVQGTARDITERRQAQEVLRNYSKSLIDAQEAERRRIARELHDEIGQVLTAVKIRMQTAQELCQTSQAAEHFDDTLKAIDEGLGQVQDLSLDLRPPYLDECGLAVALRWYVDRFSHRTGIPAEMFSDQPEDQRLPRELETACFRIAQEALTNVGRHSGASRVSIQLKRSNGALHLAVRDDGHGFDASFMRSPLVANATLGLRGMEERVHGVGGRLEIQSRKGQGTEVHCHFPLV